MSWQLVSFVQLGPNLSWGFEPKMNTKITLRPPPPPPKTLRRVLGIAGGQNLVCRLHVGQWTKLQSFNPPWGSLPPPWVQKSFKPSFWTWMLSSVSVLGTLVRPKVFQSWTLKTLVLSTSVISNSRSDFDGLESQVDLLQTSPSTSSWQLR